MIPKTMHTYDVLFPFWFAFFVNYKSVKYEPISVDLLQKQNLKTCRVQVSPK